jgi:hypothetical protein
LEAVEETLVPVSARKEARSIEFRENDQTVTVLGEQDVDAIVSSCEERLQELVVSTPQPASEQPHTITGTLYTYGPVFDARAPNWRFLYKRKPIYADIRETNIARDAVRRGGAFTNDRYKVRMEVTPPAMPDGPPHYKIKEVLDFTPADRQIPLPLKSPPRRGNKKKKEG